MEPSQGGGRMLYEKAFTSKRSGDEVECTNCFISLVKNMLCSKFHRPQFLI